METTKISQSLLKRLPIYLNHLKNLPEKESNVSATAIAAALGLGHVQVRKDLAKVSEEGRRRTGRSREQLIRDIEQYLGYSSVTTAVLIGAGPLGQVLRDYSGFANSGLDILACFDFDPAADQTAYGKPVYPMSRLADFCRCYDVEIGIIATVPEMAQTACDGLIESGIQAIWNFAPVHLRVPSDVVLQSENLTVSINTLRMQMRMKDKESE